MRNLHSPFFACPPVSSVSLIRMQPAIVSSQTSRMQVLFAVVAVAESALGFLSAL